MDLIISRIAALGVPGLILLVVMGLTGWAGAAAITTALAVLGGPFGMLGGIATLGILSLISKGIADYGFEQLVLGVIDNLEQQGMSRRQIAIEVSKYPISREMKLKIKDYLNRI